MEANREVTELRRQSASLGVSEGAKEDCSHWVRVAMAVDSTSQRGG